MKNKEKLTDIEDIVDTIMYVGTMSRVPWKERRTLCTEELKLFIYEKVTEYITK